MVSTVFVALTMAFVGAFLSVIVSILLPSLLYLKINVAARKFGLELVTITGIMVIRSGRYIDFRGSVQTEMLRPHIYN